MKIIGEFLMWFGLISSASWGWTQDEVYPIWIIGTIAFVLGWVLKRLHAVSNILSDDGIGGLLRLILVFQTPLYVAVWFGVYGIAYGIKSAFF